MHEQDQVGPPVPVDVAHTQVAGLDEVGDVPHRLAFEDLEREGPLELARRALRDDLDEVLARVDQGDVVLAVGVEVADDQVGEPGLLAGGLVAVDELEPLALAAREDHAEPLGPGQ